MKIIEKYCTGILESTKCAKLPFHNINHTREVVNNVGLIANNSALTRKETDLVKIAAWFHDLGFCNLYQGHENVSIKMAHDFLIKNQYSDKDFNIVKSCIEATKMPQKPLNKYAEILSDADLFHVSDDTFFYRKLLLRREWELEFNKFSTDLEWHVLNLEFLKSHSFYTNYGKLVLMKGQVENEKKVLSLIAFY